MKLQELSDSMQYSIHSIAKSFKHLYMAGLSSLLHISTLQATTVLAQPHGNLPTDDARLCCCEVKYFEHRQCTSTFCGSKLIEPPDHVYRFSAL